MRHKTWYREEAVKKSDWWMVISWPLGYPSTKKGVGRKKNLLLLGIFLADGEEWQKLRSKVNQDMMRPQAAYFYVDKLQVKYLDTSKDSNGSPVLVF